MLVGKLKAKHDAFAETKLAPEETAKLLKKGAFLLDVRTKLEAKGGVAPGATNISLFTIRRHLDELPKNKNIVLYCGTGARAGKAKEILDAEGFKAFNGGGYETILKVLEDRN
jgi:phage shock protein E